MSVTSANRLELLQIADAVAREKMIDPALVIEAMEDSLGKAARSRYGAEYDIRAKIDRKSGELFMTRYRHVVEEPENLFTELTLDDARRIKPDVQLDDYITDSLPPMDFGRIAAQSAKQVIMQKVREAERLRQYEEFKDRGRRDHQRHRQAHRVRQRHRRRRPRRGDPAPRPADPARGVPQRRPRPRAASATSGTRRAARRSSSSRTAPEFLAELFKMEVPEIYDGVIEIKAVARDPGSRAKMGVISYDSSIDPVGACVGMRGSRVQAVVGELQGEKIDIIPWNQDPATFLVNALQPAEVSKVVFDDESERIEVVVPDEQLSLAIGRRGQNVRLASQLTGFDIDILTEAQESERRQAEFAERTKHFMETMNVDEMVAQLLVAEGFTTLEEVAYVDIDELTSIDGFDQNTAEELQARARESLEELNAKAIEHAQGARGRAEPLRLRGADAADDRDPGRGRDQDAGGLRQLRGLGARRRLHHRRRQAGEGHRAPGEVRHEPRGGADAGDERPRPARLGRPGRPRQGGAGGSHRGGGGGSGGGPGLR